MYFQFLVEDQSGRALIEVLMEKIAADCPDVSYGCNSFHGLGQLPKKDTVKEIKTGKLLNDLAIYLRGFNKSLQNFPAAVFVVLDNDTHDPDKFLAELQGVADLNQITIDHVFCIAVEEIEAWLLGDRVALTAAYPSAKSQILNSYEQDSICGTWEVLADAVYPGGLTKFRKDCPTYPEVGTYKSEWARRIGAHMELTSNASPSFQHFITEVQKRLPAT